MRIEAHAVEREFAEKFVRNSEEFAAVVHGKRSFRTFDVSGLSDNLYEIALGRARLAPTSDETLQAWRRAGRCASARFLLARGPDGQQLPVPIDHRMLIAPADPTIATAAAWGTAASFAVASGDDLARWLMLTSPPQTNTPGVISAPWGQPLSEALPMLLTRDPRAPAALMRAVEATDPDRLHSPLREVALNVASPGLECLYRVFADPPGFEATLAKALELHRDYWSPLPQEESGWVALLPLCAARLARERGVPFDVTSEYLPPVLLDAPPAPALGCPYCVAPIEEPWTKCPSCLEDLGRDAPFELAAGARESMERKTCIRCTRRIPKLATKCATCRTKQ